MVLSFLCGSKAATTAVKSNPPQERRHAAIHRRSRRLGEALELDPNKVSKYLLDGLCQKPVATKRSQCDYYVEILGIDTVYTIVTNNMPQNRLNKFYPEYFYTKKAPLIRSELKVDPRRYERALKHVVAARQSQALKAMLSDLQGLKKLLDD